jgi:phage terminase Nu1 subunit (DNA packaging protein)
MTDEIVKAAELAKRWRVSARQIGALTEKGIIVRDSRGIFASESTAKYLAHLRDGAAGRTTVSDDRRRLLRAQAGKVEHELEVARDKYWLKTEATAWFCDSLQRIRGYMLAVKDRIQQRLPHLTKTDIHEIDQEIIAAITDAAYEEFGASGAFTLAAPNAPVESNEQKKEMEHDT